MMNDFSVDMKQDTNPGGNPETGTGRSGCDDSPKRCAGSQYHREGSE